MSLESVRNYFKQWNMEDRIQEFSVSSATVEEAALAIGCQEREIAKTMSFKVDDKVTLIVMAGDAKIDNPKYKAQYHTKAVMLKGDEVEEMTGHPRGGVCPFGISEDITVFLDKSLQRFEKVFPACGSRNSAIGLSINELEKFSNYKGWVDICKGWE
ncbi:YbaK/EbsC family protein [Cytobacillus firmus]|nr:YbaK/EbsC family protein [Cytobacillus firmus]